MSKMFVHYSGTVQAFKEAGLESLYNKHIVFIKGGENGKGEAVYTHGNYYGDYESALKALSDKVESLKYFSKISDGTNTASVATADGTITFSAVNPSEVSVDVNTHGVQIGLSETFTKAVNETLPNAITDINDRLGNNETADTAFGRIKTLESVVSSLTGEGEGSVESIDTKISNAINALDSTVSSQALSEGKHVSISVSEENGLLTAVTVNEDFSDITGRLDNLEASQKTYEVVKLSEEEVSALGDPNVKEAYKVIQTVGEEVTTAGELIKIYKDSALQSVSLASLDAEGNSGQFLKYVYLRASGDEEVVYLNVSEFLVQAEFKNGLQVNAAGEVSVKMDEASENFLTVSESGIKISGVQDAINAAKTEIEGIILENEEVVASALTDLDTRVINLDSKAEQLANTAESNAKEYADGLSVNYATAAQGLLAEAAAPQATTYTKDEVDAMWAWEEL